MKLPYREGTWFAIPLRLGGFAVGMIVRTTPKGKVILGYFFGPRREFVPTVLEIEDLLPNDALRVIRFGDLALIKGEWPIIGNSTTWDRSRWLIPPFFRIDELSGKAWKIYYSDTDPNLVLKEELVQNENAGYERDALLGSGAVELLLTNMLQN